VQRHVRSVAYRVVRHENDDAWALVRGQAMSPPELSAMLLAKLREIAESFLGEPVTDAIVTVPAYFNDAQRQATKDAGRIAGLDVKRIINEPTAAALAYGSTSRMPSASPFTISGRHLRHLDSEISSGVFSVKATGGDTHLVAKTSTCASSTDWPKNSQTARRRPGKDRMACSVWKEAAERLARAFSSIETEINIPFVTTGTAGPLHLERTLKRNELESLTRDLVERTVLSCKAVLADAKLAPDKIDQVVVGG
jgi:molecular chaperone DnaK